MTNIIVRCFSCVKTLSFKIDRIYNEPYIIKSTSLGLNFLLVASKKNLTGLLKSMEKICSLTHKLLIQKKFSISRCLLLTIWPQNCLDISNQLVCARKSLPKMFFTNMSRIYRDKLFRFICVIWAWIEGQGHITA